MRIRYSILTLIATAALMAGCAKQDAAPAVDLAAAEKGVWDASAAWLQLAQAKDSAGIMSTVYLPDAITVFEGVVRNGAAEIQAGLEKEFTDMPASTTAWTTTAVKVAPSGDVAWETGAFTFDPDGEGETAAVTGNFVTVWTKADGAWRVAADSGSSPKPEPAAEAAPAAGA